jgi:methylmalonyl-CoA mutase cobalamin-binding domain/chain
MSDVRSSIKLAARRTGLTEHVIRMWEKRYDAVTPDRTGTKRRLYSEEDIERLGLLRSATVAGHRIGDIANLRTDQLRTLASGASTSGPAKPATATASAEDLINEALTAARALDATALETNLERSVVAFGCHGMLENVVAPLAHRIGELWATGVLTAAHEHFATGVISTFLQNRFRPFAENGSAPLLVAVTPTGQLHELGAALVSAAARDLGWRVVYLGASLPAPEIANVALKRGARAVALSIVYPADDAALPAELEFLRKLLPAEIAIVAGGRAAESYRLTLEKIGAAQAGNLREFSTVLDRLRTAGPGPG